MPANRILVVDDDAPVLGLLLNVLTRRGYTVTGTTCGRAAIETALDASYDLAILDLSMPEVGGFEILQTLRARRPRMKFMVISGAMPGVMLESARIFGAAATLTKPVLPETLTTVVGQVLRGMSPGSSPVFGVTAPEPGCSHLDA
jgi:two-component system catabolic regulation response regulator CreB